jgi:hypothetical protein
MFSQRIPDKPSEFILENLPNGNHKSLPKRSALENQKMFLDKYSINVELPSMYVLDAQINNLFPDYCFQLVKCVIPKTEKLMVQTNYQDGRTSHSSFNEILEKYK